jgi:hypothetical protein
MVIFDPNIPEAESRLQSEPIRRNFNALNDRTDQLTPVVTSIAQATAVPSVIGVSVGKAEKVYFEDNLYTPFAGAIVNLASASLGVSKFNTPGAFKEVIIFYKREAGEGVLGFIESAEQTVRNHNIDTAAALINNVATQYQPDLAGDSTSVGSISPLDDAVIVCSLLVTNNGQVGIRGAISPVFESDLIDIRPFLSRTPSNKALQDHIDAPTLAAAHPTATITNDLLQSTSSQVTASTVSATVQVANGSLFDPSTLLYQPFVRFTSAPLSPGSVFQTAKVLSVLGNVLTLDHTVSVTSGDLAIRGSITLDKMTFDLVDQLSDVLEYNIGTGDVQLKTTITNTFLLSGDVTGTVGSNTVSTVDGKTAVEVSTSVDDTQAATNANIASTIVKRDGSGNFSAGTISASLNGNASTASQWATSRTINLTGDVSGSASIDGTANVNITTTIAPNSVALGTDTTGNYVATIAGTTNQVNVSGSGSESAAVTLSLPQDIATTSSPTFATVNASLNGNASTASQWATTRTISLTGDVTGSTNIDGSGNISIATTASGVTANAETLTGVSLNSPVVNSSLTSVGTLTSLSVNGPLNLRLNSVDASYGIDTSDFVVNVISNFGGSNITFPFLTNGRYIILKNSCGSTLNLIRSGGGTIDASLIDDGYNFHFMFDSGFNHWLKIN